MRTGALAISILAAAASLSAQSQQSAKPPAPETRVITPKATLITSVAVAPEDSPLVRAAKRAVAARQNGNVTNRVVISSANLRRGKYAQATGPVNGPKPLPPTTPANPPAPTVAPDPTAAAVAARIEALKQEQKRLAAEADEPYGGDIEEDDLDARQKQTQQQLEQLEKLQKQKPPA
jgi:hypothetical protein